VLTRQLAKAYQNIAPTDCVPATDRGARRAELEQRRWNIEAREGRSS
jgi:hypothetical protein